MCTYLDKIFHYIRPSKGDFKLYDKTKPIPKDLSVVMCQLQDAPETAKVCRDTLAFECSVSRAQTYCLLFTFLSFFRISAYLILIVTPILFNLEKNWNANVSQKTFLKATASI